MDKMQQYQIIFCINKKIKLLDKQFILHNAQEGDGHSI
jgi:hypothetical protein